MKFSSSKITLKQFNEYLYEIEWTEMVFSGLFRIKKKSLAEKKIKLLIKGTDVITNSTLVESQGIRESMMFCLSLKCLLEMNLLIEICNLSRMFSLSRFSKAIFKILQSIKVITLWRKYLTVPQVVPQAQPTYYRIKSF